MRKKDNLNYTAENKMNMNYIEKKNLQFEIGIELEQYAVIHCTALSFACSVFSVGEKLVCI